MSKLHKDMKSVLASLPPSYQADRAELLKLMLSKGILRSSPDRPIYSPDGKSGRWMIHSLGVTLEARGAELAARCLLPLLERFDGRQLATYGLIGVPLVQSCILQSKGRYRGLLIRKEAKPHGSMRVIEGEIDPDEPVIVVDDSIVSGRTFFEAVMRLQGAGLRVEGGAFLVRFGWPFGVSDAQERGFHIETVFDLHEDFMANMEGEEKPVYNPSKAFPEISWSNKRAPEGMHPAHLARLGLTEYLTTGKLPLPPERLNQNYDASGGAWVSMRSKANIYQRHARDGFWNFPAEEQYSAPEAVLRAALLTAHKLPDGNAAHALVDGSHIAVTFFSELEECTVGELDNDHDGIVVGSRERPGVMGGALPRMPGIGREFRLFRHARFTNGKLLPWEPYVIHRHGVMKYIEPGAPWQHTGVPAPATPPAWQDRAVCEPIVRRARDLALHEALSLPESAPPLRRDDLPQGMNLLFVTVYVWGRLRGCAGLAAEEMAEPDDDLRRLVKTALTDERFSGAGGNSAEAIAVSVSFLHNRATLEDAPPEEIVKYVVHGRQALQVSQRDRSGLVLPFWAAMHSLTPEEYALEVIDKAGITRPPYHWHRFDCGTWLAEEDGVGQLEGAFKPLPVPEDEDKLLQELAGLYSNYLLRHHREDGTFYESYEPFRNRLLAGGHLPRLAHGGWVLARSARAFSDPLLHTAADRTLNRLLRCVKLKEDGIWLEMGENTPSASEIAFLVLGLCELPKGDYRRPQARGLGDVLWSSIDGHGRIATHSTPEKVDDIFQDYFPSQVLLALAAAVREGLTETDDARLERAFRYYRHRFRYQRNFGQVSWLMQAVSAWWRLRREMEFAELLFEIGDWILEHQQEKTGGFLSDDQPDAPGYTSALYLEGISAAVPVAREIDPERHDRYWAAYIRGLKFLHGITIQQGHAAILPNTDYAIGGLRMCLDSSFVRIDFVQHGLSCVLEFFTSSAASGAARRSTVDAVQSTAV
ncbi:MAG TPA: AMMECR1 domain-containing protein [Candidatus Angelobacter sp.]|nr:AMMECR1 domain-containing protein [Candidatus Angelobacter sp.]